MILLVAVKPLSRRSLKTSNKWKFKLTVKNKRKLVLLNSVFIVESTLTVILKRDNPIYRQCSLSAEFTFGLDKLRCVLKITKVS